jgi:hypothetical protein
MQQVELMIPKLGQFFGENGTRGGLGNPYVRTQWMRTVTSSVEASVIFAYFMAIKQANRKTETQADFEWTISVFVIAPCLKY